MKVKFSNGFIIDCSAIAELTGDYDIAPVEGLSDPNETVLNITAENNSISLQELRSKITSSTINVVEIDNEDSVLVYEGFSTVRSISRNISNNNIMVTIVLGGKNITLDARDK